ncbi:SDR family oxidoreductase [Hydrogenophaga sp.]|uniref:UDP-glucose 4-epimerase family protein n=1 Tax=Hydrogenophaga sp. TaxID=1904254 RepID=UPI0027276CFC|nr:SDR family oxidoreductase [Hydrogenophaga sp.]MDO9438437.1 SDR family oxidoreductase [Hydrogenophaga sp.]
MRVMITGANGFVGKALCNEAIGRGFEVHAVQRGALSAQKGAGTFCIGSIDAQTRWAEPLQGVHTVLHVAARVHVMNDAASDPLAAFREINTAGTLHLARQAAAHGVRRLVFVSSVKVNGESTTPGLPFTATDAPAAQDAYGISKLEAEQGLRTIAAETGLEIVIVRPPLVYGPGVKANFASLVRAVHRGIPLPFGAVTNNRRSLVALGNLVDLLITCVDHPAAAHQTFLVSDGEDLSTAALIRRVGQAMGKPARLLPVPPVLLQLGATAIGKRDMAQRLLGSLQVDIAHTRNTLGWTPPIGVDEGLRRATAGEVQP